MAVYHQMGHDSTNLIGDENLSGFSGAIISPVNIDELNASKLITKYQSDSFKIIFDPQLFFPKSKRNMLTSWQYYPSDVDTVDISQFNWWQRLNSNLVTLSENLTPALVCSPVVVPRQYTDDYYKIAVETANDLVEQLGGTKTKVLQTVLVDYQNISIPNRAMAIASIISRTNAEEVYIILVSDTEPRREFSDPESLKGCIDLIYSLEYAGIKTIIGYTSTDIILWKFAGATDCASGKFFNLRRFTPKRWEEPKSSGGGQLPYWIEPSLMAFLRDSDYDRLDRDGLIPQSSKESQTAQAILEQRRLAPLKAWLGLSWRHYLNWFCEFEKTYQTGSLNPDHFLSQIEKNWDAVESAGVLMDERANDGSWIRSWRQAIRGSQAWKRRTS